MANQENTTLLIVTATLIVVLLVVVIVIIFSIFQKRKIHYILDKKAQEIKFEEEIIKSQQETQEQTLQNISWELHDNVGQLLSVARMQLNILQPHLPENQQKTAQETGEIISKSLQEIRTLSKLLNPDVVKNIGLEKSLRLELERFNRLKFLKAELQVKGTPVEINKKDEIILFRILQEFLSNSVKHAKADQIDVTLNFEPNNLKITAKDTGVGFKFEEIEKGSGLINMKSRANLINTDFIINSEKNKGVTLTLVYPYKTTKT